MSVADEIRASLISENESDRNLEPANVVDGLFAIARALDRVAESLIKLGLANADTHQGALELLSQETRDGLNAIAHAISVKDLTQ